MTSIAEVRARIEKHRRGRSPRAPLPAELWEEAAAVAAEMGAYAASRELGVSYGSLRARLEERRVGAHPVFVEVDSAAWPVARRAPEVEIVEPSGARLVIRGEVDVVAVVRAFRGGHT